MSALGNIDFFFPMSERTDIKLPPDLAAQFSNLNFRLSTIWTLPFRINISQFYITFFIKNIYIWNKEGIIRQISTEGAIRKNRAIIVKNIVSSKMSLFFALDNNYLYCIKDILNTENEAFQVKIKEQNLQVDCLTLSKDHCNAIILTSNRYVYFATSDGTVSDKKYLLSQKVSFIKELNNNKYIGVFQNIIYQFNENFKLIEDIELDDYYQIFDVIEGLDLPIVVGYSYDKNLLLSKFNIFSNDDQLKPISVGADYECIHILKNDTNPLQPSLSLISNSGIILFNSNLEILGKLQIPITDFLISSFILKTDSSNKLFVHFSKGGIHSYTPYDININFSDLNFYEILFYFTYLFNRSDKEGKKKEIASSFYEKIKNTNELEEFIPRSERDGFETYGIIWSYEQMAIMHNNLIQMMYYMEETSVYIPYLNTNAIYIYLLEECSKDDNLYRISNFGNLNQLLKRFSVNSIPILLLSIKSSIEKGFGDYRSSFDGYSKLLNLIDNLNKIEINKSARLQLFECKYLLTGEFADNNEIISELKGEDFEDFEDFAIKYKLIDILYTILNQTLDFSRAIRYSQQLDPQDLYSLYTRFQSNREIQRQLAVLQGWENVDKFSFYENGTIVNQTEFSGNEQETFSQNALALLCISINDSDEVKNAIEQLNINLLP